MAEYIAKHEYIIGAMLACSTLSDVSVITKIPLPKLREILKKPTFIAQYNETKRTMLEQAVIKLNSYATASVDILYEVAKDVGQPGNVRVSACRTLLEALTRVNEQADILRRIEELERQAEAV